MVKQRLLSVVTPVFNEEGNIAELYQELLPILSQLTSFDSYEILMVNDGSSDRSLTIMKSLAAYDSRVKVISFTRNFGHEPATYAGIVNATGDAVVLIDADRQDPPELILEFEKQFNNGYDIVYGQRSKRLNESWLKKLTSKAFYPLFKFLTRIDMPRDVGDFCLLSRKAVNCFKQLPERSLFVRGLIYWSGLPKKSVQFVRRSRGAGKSHYNYYKLTIFALENIISFSTVPIYCIIFFSLFMIALCIIGSIVALGMHFGGYVVMTGWTSLMICMFLLSLTTILSLGIIGLYIGKIFQEIKGRPIFMVDEKINFDVKNITERTVEHGINSRTEQTTFTKR